MPRIRKITTNQGTDGAFIKNIAEICFNEKNLVRSVVKDFNICHLAICNIIYV